MGRGIAQAAAQAGIPTVLYELNPQVLQDASSSIEKNLDSLVAKGKMSAEEKTKTLERILFSGQISDAVGDLCIEAIVEKPEAKLSLFHELEEVNNEGTVFATNTSSLSVTTLAKKMKDPSSFAGMHFFNPATIMKLVEIVTTPFTRPGIAARLAALAKRMGKVPVVCRDAPGFIVNRVARPFYIESLRILEEEKIDFPVIDKLLESAGFRMGPYRLMDLIGNDINYAVSCSVYDQLGSPGRLKPSAIQEEKVKKGLLGRKTGEGYYTY
jgi:3-hydroxybutyryl-CoA dehydrogenase